MGSGRKSDQAGHTLCTRTYNNILPKVKLPVAHPHSCFYPLLTLSQACSLPPPFLASHPLPPHALYSHLPPSLLLSPPPLLLHPRLLPRLASVPPRCHLQQTLRHRYILGKAGTGGGDTRWESKEVHTGIRDTQRTGSFEGNRMAGPTHTATVTGCYLHTQP